MRLLIAFAVLCVLATVPLLTRAAGPGAGDPTNDRNGDGVVNSGDQQALAMDYDSEYPQNPCVQRVRGDQYTGVPMQNPWTDAYITPNPASYYTLIPDGHPWLPLVRAGTPPAWRYC
jgi:hypothetical protein